MGKKKTRKARVCGNCGESGHDKRTCGAWRALEAEETLEGVRQSETEDTIHALVSLINGYARAKGVKMHLEGPYQPGSNSIYLVGGPDLDNAQAVAAMAGAIHHAQVGGGTEQ